MEELIEGNMSQKGIKKIHKLDESVVNKIAAGEIIIQPANALKELLENSIDARSSMIDILVRGGGLKLLQITDNGDGIDKDDLGLLCERFATSKLAKFEDLESIATYGFRGEALASISHISRLSVITKSKASESPLAFKAFYLNGKLTGPNFKGANNDPKPIAGKDGTQIIVEDLFYNIPSRLKSIKNKSDEYLKILDVIGKYAIHTDGVGFSLKKFGETQHSLITRPHLPLKERIRIVYGSECANAIINVNIDGKLDNKESDTNKENYFEKYGLLRVTGAVTNCNFNYRKRLQSIFFINHRLVSCDPLRRAINSVYQFFLPKGYQPFVYLSLELNPQILDVNVHPTKREVRFLHEDEIIEIVSTNVHQLLSNVDNSRTFKSQVLVSNQNGKREHDDYSSTQDVKKYRQENKLVRVDSSQPKLNELLSSKGMTRTKTLPRAQSKSTLQMQSEFEIEEQAEPAVAISTQEEIGVQQKDSYIGVDRKLEHIHKSEDEEANYSETEPPLEEENIEVENEAEEEINTKTSPSTQSFRSNSPDEKGKNQTEEYQGPGYASGRRHSKEYQDSMEDADYSEDSQSTELENNERKEDMNLKLSELRKFNVNNESSRPTTRKQEPNLELEFSPEELEPELSIMDACHETVSENTTFEGRYKDDESDENMSLEEDTIIYTDKKRVRVDLDSITGIKDEVTKSINAEMTNVVSHCSYIGIVDVTKRLCCFQYDVNLYLCDYAAILYEFYFQIALGEFCNYGEIELSTPISLNELLSLLDKDLTIKPESNDTVITNVINMKDMFEEYFQIRFLKRDGEWCIASLPMLIKELRPTMSKLPYFIYRLGMKINYEEEKACLEGIMRQISLLYLPEFAESDDDQIRESTNKFLQDMMFPQLKMNFLATNNVSHDIMQVADLPGLYKIFERC